MTDGLNLSCWKNNYTCTCSSNYSLVLAIAPVFTKISSDRRDKQVMRISIRSSCDILRKTQMLNVNRREFLHDFENNQNLQSV